MRTLSTSIKIIFGFLLTLVIALLLAFFFFNCKEDWCYVFEWQKVRMVKSFEDCVTLGFPISTNSSPRVCIAGNKPYTESLRPVDGDTIHVTNPLQNYLIQSPLIITGEAKGSWYFEGSFPIRLIDANGKEIVSSNVQAKSNWMTTDFVPFEAKIIFSTPVTETGTLILEKDNPSGLPQKNNSISIPIRFSDIATPSHTGRLEGTMSIGPVCPVERIDNPCKPTPEMYASKKIFIYLPDHKTLVTTLTPNGEGRFGATLSEGNYWLDITRQAIGSITGAPVLFHINTNSPAIINVSIDTGIR